VAFLREVELLRASLTRYPKIYPSKPDGGGKPICPAANIEADMYARERVFERHSKRKKLDSPSIGTGNLGEHFKPDPADRLYPPLRSLWSITHTGG